MCGIVGFTGTQQAAPILLNGLSKLEYRGYDSAGIAVRDGERLAQVVKAKGRLSINQVPISIHHFPRHLPDRYFAILIFLEP